MCLIAYSPDGKLVPDAYFRAAATDNPDGIGILAPTEGAVRFVGHRARKRAWRVVRALAARGVPYALHFRAATHGQVSRANCHPFALPRGGWLMHNGILHAYAQYATDARSDTAVFCSTLGDAPTSRGPERDDYWRRIGEHVGAANRLLAMHDDGDVTLVNEDAGAWLEGLWYSQTYSLPIPYRRRTRMRDWCWGDDDDATPVPNRHVPVRWSDWSAQRGIDDAHADDYAQYLNAAGLQ